MSAGDLLVVDVHPLLMAPQGDVGNVKVLRQRALARGIACDVVTVDADDALPRADVYLLGGTEELDQVLLAERLRETSVLADAVASGAAVLAVGAGFQVLGEWFEALDGTRHAGAGLLDVRTVLGAEVQGPMVTRPNPTLRLPALSAWESHSGRTELGTGVEPFAELRLGVGNGTEPPVDGAVAGHVIGTYLHGPLLPRNPEVADLLLRWATGTEPAPLAPSYGEAVREQRMREDLADPHGWGGQPVTH